MTLLLGLASFSLYAQNPFNINHGPYLQELTTDGVTFVFNTSAPSFSDVELRKMGSETSTFHHHSEHGLKQANATFFSVRATGLQPNTTYQYRIRAKEMKSFQPYKVVFGDSIVSQWYTFNTVNPQQKGGSIFVTSDMHTQPKLLKELLEHCDYKTCTSFFYAGDMMNYMQHGGEHPFTSFIDTSVEMFASSIPFELVRGNHETRGDLAREFPSFFPKTNGKLYGSYLLGDVMVVMLDTGEDKAASHPVYANLTDYEAYRTEQAQWLETLISTKAYRKAKYHIVISHFPMIMNEEEKKKGIWHGWQDAIDKMAPILNKANVDLLIAGHTHRFFYHEAGVENNAYPILEQGGTCAARLDMADGRIQVKVVDKEGKTLLEKTL